MTFDTVNAIYAKADTLAFCLWIPIVRELKEQREVDSWALNLACSAAIVAEQLHHLLFSLPYEAQS